MCNFFKAILLSSLLIFLGIGCKDKDRDIDLSREKLQEILNNKFPIEKKSSLASFSFYDPNLSLLENRFKINISFNYKALGISNSGTMDILGDIHYKREKSSFYLRNVEIKNLKLKDNKIKKLTSNAISTVLNSFFSINPIYKLEDKSLKERLARFLLKEIKIMEDKVLIILDAERQKKDK